MRTTMFIRTMRMCGPLLCALLAGAALAGPAGGQALPDPGAGYVMVLEPREWMGEGTRGIVRGRAVRVEGLAHHASGIRQVSINGIPALLRRDRSGATRFSGRLTAAQLEAEVEIVAYPVSGEPLARIQRPDGTFRSGALAAIRPPVEPIAAAEVSSRLQVSLQALPEDARRVLAASFAASPGVVAAPAGARAHLAVAPADGGFAVLGRDGATRHYVVAATPDEAAAALAPVLAQELGALQLETLAAPAETFPLDLAFAVGDGRLRVGEEIAFRASAGREGYFTLVDLGTDGNVAVLFPTELDDGRLSMRQPLLIPSAAVRAESAPDVPYRAQEPFGRGAVRAFVTPRPLVLAADALGNLPAETVLRAVREATTDPVTGRTLPWASAVLEYHIVP
jgi:hypothetical protein